MGKVLLIFIFIFFLTLPIFAQVDTAWVRRYNGPTNGNDEANAMTVDWSNSVYVTGSDGDYATIKYYFDGSTAWVRRYNGPGNSGDDAYAIVLYSNLVYVTGQSYGTGTDWDYDYATVAYFQDGVEFWTERYNGPGSRWDRATAITADALTVYVTGWSWGGYNDDYATIRYDYSIPYSKHWEKRYNGPGDGNDEAYAIAANGPYVYVTGESYGGSTTSADYATIKYRDLEIWGLELWVKRYNGPGNSDDIARAMAIDGSGNIYVTGGSVGSGTSFDYATIKYDPDGNELWVKRYNGPANGDDIAYAIMVDNSSNVYVTGGSVGSGTSFDFATIKYDPNGNELWVQRYNGIGNGDDVANAIGVDGYGGVCVTGYSYGSSSSYDYATLRYGSNGNCLWLRRYNGPGNGDDIAKSLVIDHTNNICVTGYSVGSGTGSDYATIKYVNSSTFICGDCNNDGLVNISDPVYLINYLFKGGPPPPDLRQADVNCDNKVSLSDIVYLINYLYKGGPPPFCC